MWTQLKQVNSMFKEPLASFFGQREGTILGIWTSRVSDWCSLLEKISLLGGATGSIHCRASIPVIQWTDTHNKPHNVYINRRFKSSVTVKYVFSNWTFLKNFQYTHSIQFGKQTHILTWQWLLVKCLFERSENGAVQWPSRMHGPGVQRSAHTHWLV